MNMMPFLFVARMHGACVNTPNFDACVRQATILSVVARVVATCASTPLEFLKLLFYMNDSSSNFAFILFF